MTRTYHVPGIPHPAAGRCLKPSRTDSTCFKSTQRFAKSAAGAGLGLPALEAVSGFETVGLGFSAFGGMSPTANKSDLAKRLELSA